MKSKKKNLIRGGILSVVILILLAGAAIFYKRNHVALEYVSKQKNTETAMYATSFDEIKDVYKASTSKKIAKELKQLAKKKGTFQSPVWAYNPFGTNQCAYYLGFSTNEETYLKYTISVNDDAIEDFTKVAYIMGGAETTKLHEYSIIGFVPGYENTVTLQLYDANDQLLKESKTTFTVPEVHNQDETIVEYTEGESKQELTDGLFAVFSWGDDNSLSKATLLYDNNGVMRSRLPQISRYGARIEQIGENILYVIKNDKLALVSPIGQVVKVYSFPGYSYHHDFEYNEEHGKILVLVNDDAEGAITEEDLVISIDVESGEVETLLDFKELFPDLYEAAVKAAEAGAVSEGSGDASGKIDWIHVNALDMVDENSMIFSGRELSLVFKIDNVWTEPVADYIIADELFVEGTDEESLLLAQGGDSSFAPQYGQHHVVVHKDDSLADGTYYVTLYNNNRGVSTSRPEIDYSGLENVGIEKWAEKDGIYSYYYKYLVDENKRTYTLVDSFEVPYAGIVSNAQTYEDNFVICSGTPNVVGEYDADGVLIRQLTLENKALTYRTQKYAFTNFWFQNK